MKLDTQNKPGTLELQKAAAALRYKLISENNMTEDPSKIPVCHLKHKELSNILPIKFYKGITLTKGYSPEIPKVHLQVRDRRKI